MLSGMKGNRYEKEDDCSRDHGMQVERYKTDLVYRI